MWGDNPDLDAAERWIDDWQAGIADRAERAAALSRRVAGLSATARGGDGLVEVTVSSSGVLSGLRLDEGVRRHSAQWIAARILDTVAAAQADLTAQVRTVAAETVGLDSETGRAVVDSYTRRFEESGSRRDAGR